MILTAGKDCKVKVWMLSSLLQENNQPYAEFGEHSEEVT